MLLWNCKNSFNINAKLIVFLEINVGKNYSFGQNVTLSHVIGRNSSGSSKIKGCGYNK